MSEIKYPRLLYKGGDREQPYVVVNDEAEEKAKREEGFKHLRDKAKQGKPGKAED